MTSTTRLKQKACLICEAMLSNEIGILNEITSDICRSHKMLFGMKVVRDRNRILKGMHWRPKKYHRYHDALTDMYDKTPRLGKDFLLLELLIESYIHVLKTTGAPE